MSIDDKPEDDVDKGFIYYKSWTVKDRQFVKRFKLIETIYHMSDKWHQKHHKRTEESIWVKLYRVESQKFD